MVVIPKKGHDLSCPQAYHPISLLNVEYKILTSILAARLGLAAGQYIHGDRTGFIPSIQLQDNIRKICNLVTCSGFSSPLCTAVL